MQESPLSKHKTINVTPHITHKLECNFFEFKTQSRCQLCQQNESIENNIIQIEPNISIGRGNIFCRKKSIIFL